MPIKFVPPSDDELRARGIEPAQPEPEPEQPETVEEAIGPVSLSVVSEGGVGGVNVETSEEPDNGDDE